MNDGGGNVVWKGWPAVALLFASVVAIGCWFGLTSEKGTTADAGVVVIRSASPNGRAPMLALPHVDPGVQIAGTSTDPVDDAGRVTATISAQYPMLKDPAFACSGGHCELTGEVMPAASDAELDHRQEMLLGGLEKLLSTNNHRMLNAIQMDEIGDDAYRIRVRVQTQSAS